MAEHTEGVDLRKRSLVSFLSLSFQSGYSAILGLIANLIFTVILTPAVYGIYFTTLALISLLNYFSDIGLAASLIQKKQIDDDDIKTTFTVQQGIIISLVIIGYLLTPYIQSFYSLPQDGIYLYWALLIAFLISSFKTIPSVLLERKIHFHKIVLVQVIENTTFYALVILLALMGYGLMSFTYGVLARAIVGLIVMYCVSFWIPRIGFSMKHFRSLIAFGFPFQASSFLALFKDDLIILFLGKIVGFEALGYIGWAKKWAEAPLRIIMDNVTKILFPVISRVQHETEKVSRLLERILFYETIVLAPTLAMMAILMMYAVDLLPRYTKWEPALPLFYIFCLSALFTSFFAPLISVFNSLGKAKLPLFFMIFWTALTWIATPILTKQFGMYGFPMAHLLLSSTFVIVVWVTKKYLPIRFIHSVYKPLIAAAVTLCVGLGVRTIVPVSWLGAIVVAIAGSTTYLILLHFVFKINLLHEAKFFLRRE